VAEIYVKVEPGSDEFRIEFRDYPIIYLEQEAESGKANSELLSRLEEISGGKPVIVSGHRSRRKKIKVDIDKGRLRGRLRKHG